MKKIIIKEAFTHDWVTREAGENLRLQILNGLKSGDVEVDFSGMTIASVSFFDESLAKLALEKELPKNWKKLLNITNINELDKGVLKLVCDTRGIVIPISEDPIKSHPWRLCPTGEHYVKAHEKKLKSGKTGHWRGTCRINPSGKEIYTSDEINEIANHFLGRELKYPQLYKEKGWNDYDLLIAGWCQFWNDTFSPSEKLSPDYIKALIATESKFKIKDTAPNKKKGIGLAQGLVQLTESTVTLLSNGAHELSDHYFEIDKKDIFDSNINICAAIRWLFRKKETAQARLKRIPTWYEVLLEYKGVLVDDSKKADQIRKDLKDEITKLGLKR